MAQEFIAGTGNRVIGIVVIALFYSSQNQGLVENTYKLETEHVQYTRMHTLYSTWNLHR